MKKKLTISIISLSMIVGVSAVAAASTDTFTHKQPVFGENFDKVPSGTNDDVYGEVNSNQDLNDGSFEETSPNFDLPATTDNYDETESDKSDSYDDANINQPATNDNYSEANSNQFTNGNNSNSNQSISPKHHNMNSTTQTHYNRSNPNNYNGYYNSCCY